MENGRGATSCHRKLDHTLPGSKATASLRVYCCSGAAAMAQAGHVLPQRSVMASTPLRSGRSRRMVSTRNLELQPVATAARSTPAASQPRRCLPPPPDAEALTRRLIWSSCFRAYACETVCCASRRTHSSSPTRRAVKAEAVAGFTRATDRPPIVAETHFNPLATERCAARTPLLILDALLSPLAACWPVGGRQPAP